MIAGIFHKGSLLSIKLSDILLSMGFQKGHIGFNKGLKLVGEWRNCLKCNKEVWFNQARIINGGGKYCSRDCSNKSTAKKGKDNPNYKKKVGYYGVHSWLYTNFGKALICEKCGSQKKVQWAKLKGKSYLRKRENFWQLCARCHVFYDDTIPYVSKGKKLTQDEKNKISLATKKGMEKAGYKIVW